MNFLSLFLSRSSSKCTTMLCCRRMWLLVGGPRKTEIDDDRRSKVSRRRQNKIAVVVNECVLREKRFFSFSVSRDGYILSSFACPRWLKPTRDGWMEEVERNEAARVVVLPMARNVS